MADITSNPWVISAADVAAAAVIVFQYKCFIYQVEFTHYTNATDTAQVNQFNGKDFAYLHAAADLQTVRSGALGHADGIVIPINGIAATGILKIYHK